MGPRRTDIVVIGMGLEEALLRQDLEECLLTREEMASYSEQVQGWHEQAIAAAAHRATHRNPNLRFHVGERVECYIGSGFGWVQGEVVAHDYKDAAWAPEKLAPYQVRLTPPPGSDGFEELNDVLVFAPVDQDSVIRSGGDAGGLALNGGAPVGAPAQGG